jgi:hypothetical protein
MCERAQRCRAHLRAECTRRRDKENIIELLKAGIEDKPIRAYLRRIAPELVDRFAAFVEAAEEDER